MDCYRSTEFSVSVKILWMLRLQAVARILYKGKAPSFEGAR